MNLAHPITAPTTPAAALPPPTAHTPGPWISQLGAIWAANSWDGELVLSPICPEILADIKAGHWDDIAPPRAADLHLMAAAPTLARWLGWALDRIERQFGADGENYRAARAALTDALRETDQHAIDAQQAQLRG